MIFEVRLFFSDDWLARLTLVDSARGASWEFSNDAGAGVGVGGVSGVACVTVVGGERTHILFLFLAVVAKKLCIEDWRLFGISMLAQESNMVRLTPLFGCFVDDFATPMAFSSFFRNRVPIFVCAARRQML